MIECPQCEGTGEEWDESACSDPDHCSPKMPCRAGCKDGQLDTDAPNAIEAWVTMPDSMAEIFGAKPVDSWGTGC